jgi:hypothetical protein
MLERLDGKVALSTGVAGRQITPATCEETHGCPFARATLGQRAATAPVEGVAT